MTEFLILKSLAHRPGHVKNRDQLMDAAYGEHIYVDDRTIDSHIKRLRKKFKAVDSGFRADRNALWRRVSIPRPLSAAAPVAPRRSEPAIPAAIPAATADSRAPARPERRLALGGARRGGGALAALSPLTRRIVAVNVLPLALLAVGFLYLGKFEASLIGQQIESLKTQGEIFAAALGEGAVLELGRRRRDPAARSGAPDDAPAGRADPHARPAV